MNGLLLLAFYVGEACACAIALSLYHLSSKPSVGQFLSSLHGVLFIGGILGLTVALSLIVREYVRGRNAGTRQFSQALAINVVVVATVAMLGEVSLRLLSVKTPNGGGETYVGRQLLAPREWKSVVDHFSAVLQMAEFKQAYLVADELLGWTTGPNRRSEDGLYITSAEGIRSAQVGVDFRGRPSSCRIAVVGDSFAFGSDGPFEDSLGHYLEMSLSSGCQVLNFAVPGYGLDQMYLRYMRDVRPWHPNVVVFGFISDDLFRTLSVYRFVSPGGSHQYWAKPRFELRDGQLHQVNAPLPKAKDVFSVNSIHELPAIKYDWAYHPEQWDSASWEFAHISYLFRFICSFDPLPKQARAEVSSEALHSINGAFLRSFVRDALAEGTIPLVAFFPVEGDLSAEVNQIPLGIKILHETGLVYADLSPCLSDVPSGARWTKAVAGHYSQSANKAAARCIRQAIEILPGKRVTGENS